MRADPIAQAVEQLELYEPDFDELPEPEDARTIMADWRDRRRTARLSVEELLDEYGSLE
jgi:hypothetical protein